MRPLMRDRPLDVDVKSIHDALENYKALHRLAIDSCYRQNSASIRIRVVDPDFQDCDRVTRDDTLWKVLGLLPEDVQSQITMLLLLTPDEAETSFANMDFDHPIPSRL